MMDVPFCKQYSVRVLIMVEIGNEGGLGQPPRHYAQTGMSSCLTYTPEISVVTLLALEHMKASFLTSMLLLSACGSLLHIE